MLPLTLTEQFLHYVQAPKASLLHHQCCKLTEHMLRTCQRPRREHTGHKDAACTHLPLC